MARENVNCLWHDIICLHDEQAVTFICKTLLQLNEESRAQSLLKTEAVEAGFGEMVLQCLLQSETGENEELEIKLPFIKEERELAGVNYFQINYLHGQLLTDKIWVESVISGRLEKDESQQEVSLGEIRVQENLDLTAEAFCCEKIIATHLCSTIEEKVLNDDHKLMLRGQHNISLLYEAMATEGEKLYICQQEYPFQEEIEVDYALEETAAVILPYSILTAKQLTEKLINIEGNIVIKISGAGEMKLENETNPKVRQRVSSRHNLAKYMRELDSIVNEEKTLRNFDLQDK